MGNLIFNLCNPTYDRDRVINKEYISIVTIGDRDSIANMDSENQDQCSKTILPNVLGHKVKITPYYGHPEDDLLLWIRDYEKNAKAMGWSDTDKVRRLPLYLKGSADDWHAEFSKKLTDKLLNWANIKEALIKAFLPCDYSSYLRKQVRDFKQGYGQSVSSFIISMQRLSRLENELVTDSEIIQNCMDGFHPEIRSQVIIAGPKTLDELMEVAKRVEAALKDRMPVSTLSINATGLFNEGGKSKVFGLERPTDDSSRVNSSSKILDEMAKAISKLTEKVEGLSKVRTERRVRFENNIPDVICSYCTRRGHLREECRVQQRAKDLRSKANGANRPRTTVQTSTQPKTNATIVSPIKVLCSHSKQYQSGELIRVPILFEGVEVSAIIDSGAQISAIDIETALTFKLDVKPYVGAAIKGADGSNMAQLIGLIHLLVFDRIL